MKITEVPIKAVTMMLRKQDRHTSASDTHQHPSDHAHDPISPSPGIDSDDKVHGRAQAQAYGGTGEEP